VNPPPDSTLDDPQRTIADLQRAIVGLEQQLALSNAERDEAAFPKCRPVNLTALQFDFHYQENAATHSDRVASLEAEACGGPRRSQYGLNRR
jgi:hypothetical protein